MESLMIVVFFKKLLPFLFTIYEKNCKKKVTAGYHCSYSFVASENINFRTSECLNLYNTNLSRHVLIMRG